MPADRLLIFCKAPLAGRVKTRLSPPLPPDDAASFYEAALRDVIALAGRERGRVELWYDEPAAAGYFSTAYPHVSSELQGGGGFGERQKDAFARSFEDGAERVVIVMSDSPTLPESHLNAAFDGLRDAPGVIGPTVDGGYYLIGLQQSSWPRAASLFEDISWSSDVVLAETLQRAQQAGVELRVLPGWYDCDRPNDLERVRADALPDSNVGRWFQERAEPRPR
jgi:rSAM/selenodomain-associated transferase 1